MDSLTLYSLDNSTVIDLSSVTKESLRLLTKFAKSSSFSEKITKAYGTEFDAGELNSLRQDWLAGDFSNLPTVRILSSAELHGINGAFSSTTNTIYLSREFLNLNATKPKEITKVLLEEIGHYLDSQINDVDAVGDEGKIFSTLVSGGKLSNKQLAQLKAKNDFTTIVVDGQTITVEAAAQDNLGLLSDKVDDLLNAVKGKIPVGNLENIPLLGSLNTDNYVNQLFNGLLNQVQTIETDSVPKVRQSLFTALGGFLADLDGDKDVDLEDVKATETAEAIVFKFKLGKSFDESISVANSFGLPTLGLDLNGNASTKVDIGLTVGFGVDKNRNVFLNTGDTGEFQITLAGKLVDASNNPLTAQGKLGFLNLQGVDNGSQVNSNFTADLTSASADANGRVKFTDLGSLSIAPNPKLTANADLKFKLNTGLGAEDNDILPSIEADFNLIGWQYDSSNPATPAPSVSFDNVALDVGSLVTNFAGGILEDVQDILEPVKDIIDPLITPLPVIDRSFVDLATENLPQSTREFIDILVKIYQIARATDSGKIPLGNFNLSGDIRTTNLRDTNPVSGARSLASSSLEPTFLRELEEIGFEFPLFDNLELNTVGILLGNPNITLFTFETPEFKLDYELDPKIIIPILGPIVIEIGGGVEAGAQITVGYDTNGLATGDLTNGFFVARPNIAGGQRGNIFGSAEVTAAAALNVGIASISVGGGISLDIDVSFAEKLDEMDGNNDFKIRGDNFFNELDKGPFCIFDLDGGLSIIIFGQIEVDLGFFSVTERLDLADIQLLDFESEPDCETADFFNHENPEPTPQQQAALDAAGIIDRRGTDVNNAIFVDHKGGTWSAKQPDSTEQIEVRGTQTDPDPKTYDKVTLVVINGLAGNDTIAFINGVQAPGQVNGGDGNDNITTGKGNDFIIGGQGNDTIDGGAEGRNTAEYSSSPNGINVNLALGFASNDGFGTQDTIRNIQNVQGSAKNDTIVGNSAENYLNGGTGNDILEGGNANDVLLGGEGADTIRGGGDFDTTTYFDSRSAVFVNLSNRNFFGDVTLPDGISPLFLNANSGQGGSANGDRISEVENVSGSSYNDILIASDGDGTIDGWLGNDTIYAGPRHDTLIGGDNFNRNGIIDPGKDWLSYRLSNAGVSVNLKDNSFSGGYADGDKLQKVVYDANGKGSPQDGNSFENLEGSTHSDSQLRADGGNNIIRGLGGNDSIYGEGGNDLINGGAGADFLDGGEGEDTATYIDSSGGVYVDLLFNEGLFADAQGDTFTYVANGISTIENLIGSNFGDTLYGDNGNNKLYPSLSSRQLDFVDGEGGINTLLVDYSIYDYGLGIYGGFNGVTTGNIKHYDTDGTALLDEVTFEDIQSIVVTGTIRDDSIIGGVGSDTIWLSEGDDFIDGGAGSDKLDGNYGIDTLSKDFSNTNENIVLEGLDFTEKPNTSRFIAGNTIAGFEIYKDIKTGSGNDKLTQVGRINNNFSTGAGADTVNPGLGFDNVDGGKDTFFGIELNVIDTLILDYSVEDTVSAMTMFVTPGDKTGFAFRGVDPDDIGPRVDSINFSNFEQYQVKGTSKGDTIVLGDGNDTIEANAGDDSLRGNGGNDSLNGGEGSDILRGTDQNRIDIDILTGGTGADLFVVGDLPTPGTPEDLFYEQAGFDDYAYITDFNPLEGDKIRLLNCGSDGLANNHGYVFGNLFFGIGIYAQRSNGLELLAFVEGASSLDLNASYFEYVGTPCSPPPR